jgi:thymidylate kinase (EC 2.7.4.9)
MFISLDGGDGVGKSTQVALLADWLCRLGYSVITCRDPGSTRLGEAIRSLLLDRHDLQMTPKAEMLLYMAARAQMVEEVIRPALVAGQTVLADRYLLANVVYQGYGAGLDVETLWQIGRVATGRTDARSDYCFGCSGGGCDESAGRQTRSHRSSGPGIVMSGFVRNF